MNQEQIDHWLSFQERALSELRRTGYAISGVGTLMPIAKVLVVPSFHPAVCYCVSDRIEPLNDTRYYGVKTVWRMDVDLEKLQKMVVPLAMTKQAPTIELEWIKVHPAFIDKLRGKTAELHIKVDAKTRSVFADGTGYEMIIGEAKFQWQEHAPLEWSKLEEIAHELIGQFS